MTVWSAHSLMPVASPLASEAGLGGIDLPALRAYASSFGQVDALLPAALMAQLQHVHTLLRSRRAWAWQMGVMHARGGARRGEVPISLKTDGERGRGGARTLRVIPHPLALIADGLHADVDRMLMAPAAPTRTHGRCRWSPLHSSPVAMHQARPAGAVLHGSKLIIQHLHVSRIRPRAVPSDHAPTGRPARGHHHHPLSACG